MLRIALFLATNVAILVVISVVFNLLGLDGILAANGSDLTLQALLVMSAISGCSGSSISLLLSKFMAKRGMGVRIIDPQAPQNDAERWLCATVQQQAQRAQIGMPEVGVFDSPDPNAFATGANKNNALVAVSTGLLTSMSKGEVEAVLAHEVSHVANGDMVTLTLVQGVVNTFVIFLSRVVGYFVDRVILKNESGHGIGYFVTVITAQIVLGILASTIVMWVSRQREFRADAGSAELNGNQPMIRALDRLGRGQPAELPEQLAAFGISGGRANGFKKLFMSHPPIQERIEALQRG